MNILLGFVLVAQIVSAVAIIGLVLIQHGKGADMGAAFGSGASGSLFGATGSANFLSRTTGVLAAIFFICTLALSYLLSNQSKSSGVLEKNLTRPSSVVQPATEQDSKSQLGATSVTPASSNDKSSEIPK